MSVSPPELPVEEYVTERCRNAVIMGVSGVGKTTVAERLAKACGGHFLEGDRFHPERNIRAMSNGIPLTDEARWEWLARIAEAVTALNAKSSAPAFIACSALKCRYRDFLRERMGAFALIFLDGEREVIRSRIAVRTDHFMPPSLLDSQFDTLEPPDPLQEKPVCRIDVARNVEEVVREAIPFCRKYLTGIGEHR